MLPNKPWNFFPQNWVWMLPWRLLVGTDHSCACKTANTCMVSTVTTSACAPELTLCHLAVQPQPERLQGSFLRLELQCALGYTLHLWAKDKCWLSKWHSAVAHKGTSPELSNRLPSSYIIPLVLTSFPSPGLTDTAVLSYPVCFMWEGCIVLYRKILSLFNTVLSSFSSVLSEIFVCILCCDLSLASHLIPVSLQPYISLGCSAFQYMLPVTIFSNLPALISARRQPTHL